MKVNKKDKSNINISIVRADLGVRHWEDGKVNGKWEDNDNPTIPCVTNDRWVIDVDVDSGRILNWEYGNTAYVHYKICDDGTYTIFDNDNQIFVTHYAYVPKFLSPNEENFGDYAIMNIDENGYIENFQFTQKDFDYLEKCYIYENNKDH